MKSLFVFTISILAVVFYTSQTSAAQLQVKDLVVGTGAKAINEKIVVVHYTGWLMDGTKFDSSVDRKTPFEFTLGSGQVIKGWEQGVQGMRIGGKRELIIPPHLGYGPRGAGNVIPPNATLKFEVELLDLKEMAYENVDNDELKRLIEKGVKVVDIRTPREWKETGVVEGSLLLPWRMSNGQINRAFPQDLSRIAEKDEQVVLICRSGNRSRQAAEVMSSRFGFEGIINVRHGIKHWLKEKNPVTDVKLDNLRSTCSLC